MQSSIMCPQRESYGDGLAVYQSYIKLVEFIYVRMYTQRLKDFRLSLPAALAPGLQRIVVAPETLAAMAAISPGERPPAQEAASDAKPSRREKKALTFEDWSLEELEKFEFEAAQVTQNADLAEAEAGNCKRMLDTLPLPLRRHMGLPTDTADLHVAVASAKKWKANIAELVANARLAWIQEAQKHDARLITSATDTSEFAYVPALQPRDAEERALVDRVTSALAQEIDLEIAQRWTAEFETVPEFMRGSVPRLPSPAFLKDKFFDVLRAVLRRSSDAKVRSEAVASQPSSSCHPSNQRYTSDQIMAQFLSRTSGAQPRASEPTEARYVGAMQLLTEDFSADAVLKYEGYLLSETVSSRSVPMGKQARSPKKRGVEPANETRVVDVILVDPTGPLRVSLWGDLATTLENLMGEFLRKHPPPSKLRPIVVLENVRPMKMMATEYYGAIVTSMKYLETVPAVSGVAGSLLSFAEMSTSPFMAPAKFQIPPSSVVLSRFSILQRTVTPFHVSVMGVVFDVGTLEYSRQGNPKKSFKLVDEVGSWVSCVVIGEEATKPAIDECAEVLLFFTSGRRMCSSSKGALFLFQSSGVVIPMRKVKARVALREQVEIV